MNRNFLNAFAKLIGKEYADEYNRGDVIKFRNALVDKGYEKKYIDTPMDFVLTFFRHWIKLPIQMERGDRLKYAANLPEPYADEEIIEMERRAKGKFNLLVRLYRSTGCRLQEITHLRHTDINPHTKTILIHVRRVPFFRFSLMLIRPDTGAMANRTPTRWSALNGQTLISLTRNYAHQQLIDKQLKKAGIAYKLGQTVNLLDTQIGLVESDRGIAVIPSFGWPACRYRQHW